MRDMGTFIATAGIPNVPPGNHFGYIDFETTFSIDGNLPFPHLRAISQPVSCVLRVERSLHPEWFSADNPLAYSDIDVSSLVDEGLISYNQYIVPDVLADEGR
jgi:hypothetical protein